MAELDLVTEWDDGRLRVSLVNGDVQFVDRCDPSSSRSRRMLLDALREKCPGVDREDVEKHLLRHAAGGPPKPTTANEDDPSKPGDTALEQTDPAVRAEALDMLRNPELLRTIMHDVQDMGVVGEHQLALSIYLLATSRLLGKPFNGIVQGVSSTGKSYVPDRTSELFPPESKLLATSLTPNALFYLPPGSLRHRAVFAGERSRVEDDDRAEATRALREMLASGWLRKAIPIKQDGGSFETQVIEQRGPIAYVESTTLGSIFDEDANRMLLLASDDSATQTRRILDAIGQHYADPTTDSDLDRIVARHHAAQRMLRRVSVRIPFAPALSAAMPDTKPESRRAIAQAMGVVQAVALLHQFQRHDNPQHGTIIDATIADYRVARALLLEPLGRSLGGALPGGVASFAGWLKTTIAGAASFTAADLLAKPGCRWQQSTLYDYVKVLRGHGFLVTAGQDGKATLYRLSGSGVDGGAAWLPDPDTIGGF